MKLITAIIKPFRLDDVREALSEPGVSAVQQFGVQLTGTLATIVWCGGVSFILLKILDAIMGLRVSREEETEGLDLVLHEEKGYNI